LSKINKILLKVLSGSSDSNISFDDLKSILNQLGFDERIKSSHHIYSKENIDEIINLQPSGSKAKSYKVKQVRNII
jgi:predicted RNA binding protein YcfA (HicA-like mRNA interferase family)